MKGHVVKRCGCPVQYGPSGKRVACKRDHGSWSFVVGVIDPGSGRRRQVRRSGFATKGEAEAALAAMVDQAERGTVPPRRKDTFAAYSSVWLAARCRTVRQVTAESYAGAVKRACAAFGGLPLADVSRADVQRLADELADAGRSARTVGLVLFVVRSVFEEALHEGLLVRNPAARVKAAGRPAVERHALTVAELQQVAQTAGSDPRAALWSLTLCGLRRSEVLGLRWSDVDLAARTVTVERGVTADGHGRRHSPTDPKTRRGTRVLPLRADQVDQFRQLREAQAAAFGFAQVRDGWLAVDDVGAPLRPERWSDLWRRLCVAAGVRSLPLHAARHSSVTMMRAQGVSDAVVSAFHGHDETVMRRTYTHVTLDELRAAGDQNVTSQAAT